MNYTIGYISYNNDDQDLKNRSVQILNDFFSVSNYTIKPDEGKLVFIASGGSEQYAVQRTKRIKTYHSFAIEKIIHMQPRLKLQHI
ncbi:MAG: hypothetical protein R2764_03520 [Bacteroidales bacterium]